jgi:hypothetical protein
LPALSRCAFNPVQVASGSGSSAVTVSVSTTAPTSRTAGLLLGLPLAALLFAKPQRHRLSRLLVCLCFVGAIASCGGGLQGNGSTGGGGSPGTKPGSYTVTLTASSGTVTHSTNVTLTVSQ